MIIDRVTGEVVSLPDVRDARCARYRVTFDPSGESMTQQNHCEAADVNKIIQRYERTGILPPAREKPVYADVTGLQGDFAQRIDESRSVIGKAKEFERDWHAKKAKASAADQGSDDAGSVGKAASGAEKAPKAAQPKGGEAAKAASGPD